MTAPRTNKGKKPKAGGELRIRMYRVGFGDFFLMTVPSKEHGPQHVLVDCGVTNGRTGKGDIKSLKGAVAHMAEETDFKLALIIVTHRHQDHIIGFSRCADLFEKFQVGAVWMPFWEMEYDPDEPKGIAELSRQAAQFQADLTSMAFDVQQHIALAARRSPEMEDAASMLENATGISVKEGPGGGSNAKSLALLKSTFGKPKYYYKGQKPHLPKPLVDAGLAAMILGPPPPDELAFMKLKDLKKTTSQYLSLSAATGGPGAGARFSPFGSEFHATSADYPPTAFREWAPRTVGVLPDDGTAYSGPLEQAIRDAQPEMLFTAAKMLDGFLNNQSLVVYFTWNGKKLLFAGDAQAGNWLSWLSDLDTPTNEPSAEDLSKKGAAILADLDFYKVGHHGSTNATPIIAVEAMGLGVTCMCSTQADSFGKVENNSEVPRIPLMKALGKQRTVVRSDQIPIKLGDLHVPRAATTPTKLPTPTRGRLEVGSCYIDYLL
jgi:beta-lactamase superfamily II metal-dependent hydrolase